MYTRTVSIPRTAWSKHCASLAGDDFLRATKFQYVTNNHVLPTYCYNSTGETAPEAIGQLHQSQFTALKCSKSKRINAQFQSPKIRTTNVPTIRQPSGVLHKSKLKRCKQCNDERIPKASTILEVANAPTIPQPNNTRNSLLCWNRRLENPVSCKVSGFLDL